MSPHRHTARDHGFSLIEMLVVVIVLGVLAGVAIPVYLNQRAKARNVQTLTDLRNVHRLVETYATENGTYPTTGGLAVVYESAGCPNADNARTDYVPGVGETLPQPMAGIRGRVGNYAGCYMYASDGTRYVLSAWNMVQGNTPHTGAFYRRLGFREIPFAFANMYYCNHANIGGAPAVPYNTDLDYYKWSYTISNITTAFCHETPPAGA